MSHICISQDFLLHCLVPWEALSDSCLESKDLAASIWEMKVGHRGKQSWCAVCVFTNPPVSIVTHPEDCLIQLTFGKPSSLDFWASTQGVCRHPGTCEMESASYPCCLNSGQSLSIWPLLLPEALLEVPAVASPSFRACKHLSSKRKPLQALLETPAGSASAFP